MLFRKLIRPKRRNRRRGTVSVEMAIVAPVIFLMIFAQVEFARLMMIRQSVTNAAREGCRHACLVTTQDTDSSCAVAKDFLAQVVGKDKSAKIVKVTFTPSFSSSIASGTPVTARVEVSFKEVSWLPPFFAKDATIQASAEMNRE